MSAAIRTLTAGLVGATLAGGSLTTAQVPSASEIASLLQERIEQRGEEVGIVVGVLDPNGRRVVAQGRRAQGQPGVIDADTIFEIASVTKVFTALLLADAVHRGEVGFDDPVAKHLPASVSLPSRGRAMTLRDLATHRSGLPRLPGNLMPADPANPYEDYSVEQLYSFLTNFELPRVSGERYEYSNLGAGLLGHVLAHRAGTTYEALIRRRILEPLGMASTGVGRLPELADRAAVGHDARRRRVAYWDNPTLPGAGALWSTANDLLIFLSAAMEYQRSLLSAAFALMTSVQLPTDVPGMDIALGWHVLSSPGHRVLLHDGGTGGFRSAMAFSPDTRTGVVVLSNTATPAGVTDIALHVLDPNIPAHGIGELAAVAVDTSILEQYVGEYQLTDSLFVTITRDDEQLFAQLTGQPRFEMIATSDRDFVLKDVDVQASFETDSHGLATAVVIRQLGQSSRAVRLGGSTTPRFNKAALVVVALIVSISALLGIRYLGRRRT